MKKTIKNSANTSTVAINTKIISDIAPPLLNPAKSHFQTSFGPLGLLNLRTANSILN
jgi:hypothetical protein